VNGTADISAGDRPASPARPLDGRRVEVRGPTATDRAAILAFFFHAEVLGGNVRMLGLLRDIASPLQSRIEAGVARIDFGVSG